MKKHSLLMSNPQNRSLAISNNSIKQSGDNGLELVFIIDKSGSMFGKEPGIMSGYNKLIKQEHLQNRNILLTTVLFDSDVTTICDGQEIEKAKPLKYNTGSITSLFDAVGCAIDHVNLRKDSPENLFPNADVGYVIVTDGEENSSTLFTQPEIYNKIMYERTRTDKGNRDFIMLGELNIDIEKGAEQIGIDSKKTQTYIGGSGRYSIGAEGLKVLFQCIDYAIKDMLAYGEVSNNWQAKTNNLMVGDMTLKELKTSLKGFKEKLVEYENAITALEIMAKEEGLSYKFFGEHTKCQRLFNALVKESKKYSKAGTANEVISGYINQKQNYLEGIKQIAACAEIEKRLNSNEIHFGKQDAPSKDVAEKIAENLRAIQKCFNRIDEPAKNKCLNRVLGQEMKLSAMRFVMEPSKSNANPELCYYISQFDALGAGMRDKDKDAKLLASVGIAENSRVLKQPEIDMIVK